MRASATADFVSDLPCSYGDWYAVAKGNLKWNDHCTSLFWEMLTTATSYLSPDEDREDMQVDMECMAIFLAMHIAESTTAKPAAPTVAFEAVWPLNENGEVFCSSPIASPSSSPARDARRSHSPLASPMSPRSPRNSPQKPSSPRTHTSSTRTPRASTQHLHSVRQKIPLILRALNSSELDSTGPSDAEESSKLDFKVSKRVTDALGLVLCGGQSRDQTVSPLSLLHPAWAEEGQRMAGEGDSVLAHEFVSWINLHLSMNDLLYPALQTPSMLDSGLEDNRTHQPQRVAVPLGSLSRFTPTVLSAATATTIMHVVTSGYSRASSFRSRYDNKTRLNSSEQADFFEADVDLSGLDIVGVTYPAEDASSSPHRSEAGSISLDDLADSKFDLGHDYRYRDLTDDGAHAKLESALPQLFINYCNRSKIYMISPYYSATVTGCADCDILIGAVYGAVIVNGCERVRLTVACRRLIVINCLECDFQIATTSPTVVIGDCRNISMGPHNANYRNLKHHLRLADLSALTVASTSTSANQQADGAVNMWNTLCDVNACIDLVGTGAAGNGETPSSQSIGESVYELPPPHAGTAVIQSTERFHALVVPIKGETAQLEVSALLFFPSFANRSHACQLLLQSTPLFIPREYRQSLAAQKQAVEDTKAQLLTLIRAVAERDDAAESVSSKSSMSDGSSGEGDLGLLSSALLTKKFMVSYPMPVLVVLC